MAWADRAHHGVAATPGQLRPEVVEPPEVLPRTRVAGDGELDDERRGVEPEPGDAELKQFIAEPERSTLHDWVLPPYTTQEFLEIMLGVRRPSTTLAVQALEGQQLIRARRGRITILDREALTALADDSYGLPEAEYARLIEGA